MMIWIGEAIRSNRLREAQLASQVCPPESASPKSPRADQGPNGPMREYGVIGLRLLRIS
ncbi:hypothetical protein [Cohnella silvisoli]|uniref:Uncharacterized protein n=1 Tax=Cohnella silvisoli TaxID=2873699 RepID=A0ABV1KVI4_9BACL|nr:hypothetical protein [Cohnella silvisoli]MCD9023456.1 hypothetical protein [Cohnella silvisoli]